MKKEIWKDVVGYEGVYQVSDLGNVKSLDRIDYAVRKRNGRLLKLNPNSNGYLIVRLYLEGKGNTRLVHKLVAEAFLNHIPCGHKLVVDHIDNDKLNNQLTNLQLINQRQNTSKDKRGGSSKYVGVSFNKQSNKFVAHCMHNKKRIYLGYFKTELEASEAYNKYLKTIK
jgi:hypothetical protein